MLVIVGFIYFNILSKSLLKLSIFIDIKVISTNFYLKLLSIRIKPKVIY
jgi:hypothetical protein